MNKVLITFIMLIFTQVVFGQIILGKLQTDQNSRPCAAGLSMEDYTSSLVSVPLSLFSEEDENVIKSCLTPFSSIEGSHKLITVIIRSGEVEASCTSIGGSQFEFFAENFYPKLARANLDCSSNDIFKYE